MALGVSQENILKEILAKLQSKEGLPLSSATFDAEPSPLLNAFLPTQPQHDRSLAFLILSKLISNARATSNPINGTNSKLQDEATQNLFRLFAPPVQSRISSTTITQVLQGLYFLAALFQVDSSSAAEIFNRDGVIDSVMEAPELFQDPESFQVKRGVASLLSQASGVKACRPTVSGYATGWLADQMKQVSDAGLRAASAIAMTKLSRGGLDDADSSSFAGLGSTTAKTTSQNPSDPQLRTAEEEKLATLMKAVVLTDKAADDAAILDAVEGLAYLSTEPNIKEMIINDPAFLKRLFAQVPPARKHQTGPVPVIKDDFSPLSVDKGDMSLLYGITVIISNVVAFRPLLSEEESQIDRLRRMTKESATTGAKLGEKARDPLTDLEGDVMVKKRCTKMLKAGVLVPLVALGSRVESEGVRQAVGKSLLSLVEEKDNRGKVVQAGGVKTLTGIIRASLDSIQPKPSAPKPTNSKHPPLPPSLNPADLPAIQALAKLTITSSPLLLFGPDASSSIDAIRPLSHLLLNSSSNLLQKFEALMALTNLASLGPQVASRIAHKDMGILSKTETLLLEDNVMVRRAAVELLCNLIMADEVWERYTGEKDNGATTEIGVSRLQILLALSDVEDGPTRLAASGALAMLTGSPNVCQTLLWKMENGAQRVFTVFVELLVPSEVDDDADIKAEARGANEDSQVVHRGCACLRNILVNSGSLPVPSETSLVKEAEKAGVIEALVAVVTSPNAAGSREILTACAEALKWLTDHGAKIAGMN